MRTIIDACNETERHEIDWREMTYQDRISAVNWMSKQYGNEFPNDFFPDTGVSVLINGELSVVIPVYLENSSMVAVAGHCIANPKNTPRNSYDAVGKAIEACTIFAGLYGKKYLISIWGKRSINKMADKIGFQTADTIEEKFIKVR